MAKQTHSIKYKNCLIIIITGFIQSHICQLIASFILGMPIMSFNPPKVNFVKLLKPIRLAFSNYQRFLVPFYRLFSNLFSSNSRPIDSFHQQHILSRYISRLELLQKASYFLHIPFCNASSACIAPSNSILLFVVLKSTPKLQTKPLL